MDKIAGVYKITNKVNNKVYIGESEDISRRWVEHLTDLVSDEHCNHDLQDDFNKYGIKNFKFETIETIMVDDEDKDYSVFKTKMSLLCREFYYINKYHAIDDGYNVVSSLKDILINHRDIYYRDRPADKVMQIMIHRFLKDHINLIKDGNVIKNDCVTKVHSSGKKKNKITTAIQTDSKQIKMSNEKSTQLINLTDLKNMSVIYKELKELNMISFVMPISEFRKILSDNNIIFLENYSWRATEYSLNNKFIVLGKESKNPYGYIYKQILFTKEGEEKVKEIFQK